MFSSFTLHEIGVVDVIEPRAASCARAARLGGLFDGDVALQALDVEVSSDQADGAEADEVDVREDGDEETDFAFIMLMTIA